MLREARQNEKNYLNATMSKKQVRASKYINTLMIKYQAVLCGLHVHGEASADSLVPEDKRDIGLLVY